MCIAGKRDTFPQVVTSRYPVKIVKRINGNGEDLVVVHGAGYVEVDVNGEKLNIVTVHTYPFRYAYLAQDQKATSMLSVVRIIGICNVRKTIRHFC